MVHVLGRLHLAAVAHVDLRRRGRHRHAVRHGRLLLSARMERPLPLVRRIRARFGEVQHDVVDQRRGAPDRRTGIRLARVRRHHGGVPVGGVADQPPLRGRLVPAVHRQRVVRERGAVPAPVARIAVGDAAGILPPHPAATPKQQLELVVVAVPAAMRPVVHGQHVVGQRPLRRRRAAAKDREARTPEVPRGRRRECGVLPRGPSPERVRHRPTRLLGHPPAMLRIAPPCPCLLVEVRKRSRGEPHAGRVVYRGQEPVGGQLAEGRVEEQLECRRRLIAEVAERREVRRQRRHRVELVAPGALVPAPVFEDAPGKLVLPAGEPVDGLPHARHVPHHERRQRVGREVPALVVAEYRTPHVVARVDDVGGRPEHAREDRLPLLLRERARDRIEPAHQVDHPHGLVQHLRERTRGVRVAVRGLRPVVVPRPRQVDLRVVEQQALRDVGVAPLARDRPCDARVAHHVAAPVLEREPVGVVVRPARMHLAALRAHVARGRLAPELRAALPAAVPVIPLRAARRHLHALRDVRIQRLAKALPPRLGVGILGQPPADGRQVRRAEHQRRRGLGPIHQLLGGWLGDLQPHRADQARQRLLRPRRQTDAHAEADKPTFDIHGKSTSCIPEKSL